jgi:hypothetical protein
MSYDLYLFRLHAGEDPDAGVKRAMDKLEEGGGGPPAELRDRLITALQARNPNLPPFNFDYDKIAQAMKITADEARARFQHVELTDLNTGLQITLYAEAATITVPYHHSGAKADVVFREIWDHLDTLRREVGYVAYDPQLSRVVETEDDRVAALATYVPMVAALPGMAMRAARKIEKQKKPWWRFW